MMKHYGNKTKRYFILNKNFITYQGEAECEKRTLLRPASYIREAKNIFFNC